MSNVKDMPNGSPKVVLEPEVMPQPWEVSVVEKPRSRSAEILASVPVIIGNSGERTARRFLEFFTAEIRNKNTRRAYAHAVRLFLDWLEVRRVVDLTCLGSLDHSIIESRLLSAGLSS